MPGKRHRIVDLLWIAVVLVFLLPVVLHVSGNHERYMSTGQGPLLIGRASLDSLIEASAGRMILVNFWATWCSPCIGELPHIDSVYSSMTDSLVAVAVDIGDLELETLIEFRSRMQLSLCMVWLSEEEARQLKSDWDLPDLIPATLFLDASGSEYLRVSGSRNAGFFAAAVRDSVAWVEDDVSEHLHINVVGIAGDPATEDLLEISIELAGMAGVDFYDPSNSSDLEAIRSLYLPESGYPYAQPCVGTACGRPSSSREELLQAVEFLSS